MRNFELDKTILIQSNTEDMLNMKMSDIISLMKNKPLRVEEEEEYIENKENKRNCIDFI